jgi:hypothetical protein
MKKITLQQAHNIADTEIRRIIQTADELAGYEFSSVELSRENPAFWVFSAGSPKLQAEGFIPGAIFVCVDKLDGHIWGIKAQEQYFSSMSELVTRAA